MKTGDREQVTGNSDEVRIKWQTNELHLLLVDVRTDELEKLVIHADCGDQFVLQCPYPYEQWLDFDREAVKALALFIARYVQAMDPMTRAQLFEIIGARER